MLEWSEKFDFGGGFCHGEGQFLQREGRRGGDYNPTKRRILIVFDDMIAGIMTNKNFQAIIKAITIY